jgi:hypothetical protein
MHPTKMVMCPELQDSILGMIMMPSFSWFRG